MQGLSLVEASGGHSSSRCAGLSLSWPLLLRSTGSRRAGSAIVAHGPSCSAACGIFPDQGSNPCPLNWQADSQPLRHQGSPYHGFLMWYLLSGYWNHFTFHFFLFFSLTLVESSLSYQSLYPSMSHSPVVLIKGSLQSCLLVLNSPVPRDIPEIECMLRLALVTA